MKLEQKTSTRSFIPVSHGTKATTLACKGGGGGSVTSAGVNSLWIVVRGDGLNISLNVEVSEVSLGGGGCELQDKCPLNVFRVKERG